MALLFVPHAIDSELPSSPSPYYRTLLITSSTYILLRSPIFTDARAQWENKALARSKMRHRGALCEDIAAKGRTPRDYADNTTKGTKSLLRKWHESMALQIPLEA